ncbi:MAG: hypothetical protein IJB97_08965 [Clostridia bacterium]|nr:hypothetical protein [Clostridia bacterium]
MYRTFNEYLVSKFGQNEADFIVDGCVETVIPMDESEANRIVVFYTGDMLSLSVFYGDFQRRHYKAMRAFIDTYNERDDRAYEFRYMNGQLWIEVDENRVSDARAMEIVESVLKFFAADGEIVKELKRLASSAKARWSTVGKRAKILRERACELDNRGYHKEAVECLKEICEIYFGYKHMELVALYYQHDFERTEPVLRFPYNKEYALEMLLLALERVENDFSIPLMAHGLAKELGREDIRARLEAVAQQNATWEYVAFKSKYDPTKVLKKIAGYYRDGIGCEASERNASYYDRLAAGERREVFKDMLLDGFDRVFKLMSGDAYYDIQSLAELDGDSDAFKRRYLYGDETEFLLPDWFVSLVNGLNEADRDAVLTTVTDRMQRNMDRFLERVQSGEIEIVLPSDVSLGVTIELEDRWAYVYAPDLKELVNCAAKEKLLRVFDKFKELR